MLFGYSFPYPHLAEPSGFDFILSMPAKMGVASWTARALSLRHSRGLLGSKAKHGDGTAFVSKSSVGAASSLLVFFAARKKHEARIAEALFACVAIPPIFIFASYRFLVPVMPVHRDFPSVSRSLQQFSTARGLGPQSAAEFTSKKADFDEGPLSVDFRHDGD